MSKYAYLHVEYTARSAKVIKAILTGPEKDGAFTHKRKLTKAELRALLAMLAQ